MLLINFGVKWIDKAHIETAYKTYQLQNQNISNGDMSFYLPTFNIPND